MAVIKGELNVRHFVEVTVPDSLVPNDRDERGIWAESMLEASYVGGNTGVLDSHDWSDIDVEVSG